jgi:hypothetical protein
MISAEFQLTSDDYSEAQVSHLSKVLGKRFGLTVFVLGTALAVTLLIARMDPAKARQMIPSWIVFAGLLLLMVLLRSGMFYRMQFNRTKALHQPIHFEAGDGGVVYRTSRGESTTKWEGIEKWRESKGNFLLYVQPRLFFVVPKRVLDVEQIAEFRELLKSRIH